MGLTTIYNFMQKTYSDKTIDYHTEKGRMTPVSAELYSVLLTPPIIAGLQSLAHLNIEEKILEMPISLGFSSPLIALCFITLTNSLLLSFPSPSVSNRVKTTSMRWSDNST